MDGNNVISCPPLEVKTDPNGLGSELFNKMKKFKSKVFHIDAETGNSETYEQVLTKCIRTAIELKRRNVTQTDIICISSYNHFNNIVPLIAGWMLGVKVASLDPSFDKKTSSCLLEQVKPKIIFVSEDCLKTIEETLSACNINASIVVFTENETKHSKFCEFLQKTNEEESFEPSKIKSDRETASIFFSSGTTGRPKGVCLNHFTLIYVGHIWNDLNNQENLISLIYATTYWISSINTIIRNILFGYCRLVVRKCDAAQFWELLKKYDVGKLVLAPSPLLSIIQAKPIDAVIPKNLEIVTGGGPASVEQMTLFRKAFAGRKVYMAYGATEVGGVVVTRCYNNSEGEKIYTDHPGTCGMPAAGMTYKIVDITTRADVPHGQPGELLIKADFMMNGYYNMDCSDAFENGWLKTGDVVSYHPDGCFYHLDRTKEMFKYRTWHVQPVVVEEVINRHPAVAASVVVGVPHSEDGDHPLAFVVLKDGCDVDASDIENFANDLLDDTQKLRAGVRVIKNLLFTPTGKVKRYEMRRLAIEGKL